MQFMRCMRKGMITMANDNELTLLHMQELLTDAVMSIHTQAEQTLQTGDTIGYTDLLTLEMMFAHCVKAIEQSCFVQVKRYELDPSLIPISWKDV